MDRERAEAHLRLVAEAELHGITTRPQDGASLPPGIPVGGHGARGRRQQAAAAAALYDLPSSQREVIALQYYADLSEYQTAHAIGISLGSVRAHTARGMAALVTALEAGISRAARVARVLTAAGALDGEAADQILDEFALALGTRRAGSGARAARTRDRYCGQRRRMCRWLCC